MTNEELINAIRTDGDTDRTKMLQLWNQNRGMIRKACQKVRGYMEPEDAMQECYLPFAEAVDAYDPEAGQNFVSFMYSRLTWHLIRYVQENGGMIRIPPYQRETIRKYRKYVSDFYQITGREPNDRMVCAVLDLTPDQLQQLRQDALCIRLNSLDKPLSVDGDNEVYLSDIIPDTGTDLEEATMEAVFMQQRKKAVREAVDSLERAQEREAIRLYYYEGMTYDQAGEIMGIRREKVRSLLAGAFRKLRTGKRSRALREYADASGLYSMGLRGGIGSFNRTWTSSTENAALKDLERQRDNLLRELSRLT